MPDRFASHRPGDDLRRVFATAGAPPPVGPNWNIAPAQQVMVVRRPPDTKERRLDLLRWGFIPAATTDIKTTPKPTKIPAETAPDSPLFKEAMARRRCIVPADAYYEWSATTGTLPHAIGRIDGEPLAFAAIWERWKSPSGAMMLTFAILTTPANDTVRPLAARMPVILEPQDWPLWLGEAPGDPMSLLHPAATDTLYTWTVSPDVTNPKNNGPELLDPFDAEEPSSPA